MVLLKDGPKTSNALKAKVKCSGTIMNEVTDALLESGEIQGCRVSTKAGERDGFGLVQDNPGQTGQNPGLSDVSTPDGLSAPYGGETVLSEVGVDAGAGDCPELLGEWM